MKHVEKLIHDVLKNAQEHTNKLNGKKVTLNIPGFAGNDSLLTRLFSTQAAKEGWSSEEIKIAINDAM